MARRPDYQFRHDSVIYTFKIEPQEHTFESKLQGRKVFKDVEVLNALIPSPFGIPKQENSDLVTEDLLDRKGFHDHYQRWCAGQVASPSGTPLDDFEELTPAAVKNLEAAHVTTVELFMQCTDTTILSRSVGPDWRRLQDLAKQRYAHSDDPGVRATREQVVQQQDEIDKLKAQISALMDAAKPRPASSKKAAQPEEAAA